MAQIYQFKLPDVGEGVTQAEIVTWNVKVGDTVAQDQDLLDVMTDKATVEMPSPVAGQIIATHGAPGDIAAVGSVLVEIETGEAQSEAITAQPAPDPAEPPAPPPEKSAKQAPPPTPAQAAPGQPAFATRAPGQAPLAAPATRARAFELGIALQFVPGTGPAGRITPNDLDAYIASGGQQSQSPSRSTRAPRTAVHDTQIIGLRRKIAERMQDAKARIPHFSYVEEFDLTALEALRQDLNDTRKEGQPKLTLLPFFAKAIVLLQPHFPHINARFDDANNCLQTYDGVHLGIATQTPNGLMVPVVRHVETLSIWQCAEAIKRVTTAAREGSAKRDELMGSTITLTSLGRLGGISATPVINSPEVAIIGPNKLAQKPVVIDGAVQIRTMMNVSSSFDHRIVDGYDAADFIQHVKRLIEQPARMWMEGET
ncbi:MAG: dihydrolipoamide acetyltransferase family protein [Pseudomonadota bacterium]